jgi:hypothetical protein
MVMWCNLFTLNKQSILVLYNGKSPEIQGLCYLLVNVFYLCSTVLSVRLFTF